MHYNVLNQRVVNFSEFRDCLSDARVSDTELVLELDRLYREWKEEGDFYFFLEEELYGKFNELKSVVNVVEFYNVLLGGGHNVAMLVRNTHSGIVDILKLSNEVQMQMIFCAPGDFMQGSPLDEFGRFNDELFDRAEIVKGFWLGKYPVTQRQWKCIMNDNPSYFENENNPVESITYSKIKEFIDKVNSLLEVGARLPMESEWEYACKAGVGTPYSGSDNLDDVGWWQENSNNKTHPCGEKKPNEWGFHDMHGNVCEMCNDYYDNEMTLHVTKGGSYLDIARNCRSGARSVCPDWHGPMSSVGFRLCCEKIVNVTN